MTLGDVRVEPAVDLLQTHAQTDCGARRVHVRRRLFRKQHVEDVVDLALAVTAEHDSDELQALREETLSRGPGANLCALFS